MTRRDDRNADQIGTDDDALGADDGLAEGIAVEKPGHGGEQQPDRLARPPCPKAISAPARTTLRCHQLLRHRQVECRHMHEHAGCRRRDERRDQRKPGGTQAAAMPMATMKARWSGPMTG